MVERHASGRVGDARPRRIDGNSDDARARRKVASLHKPNWLAACAAVHAAYFVGMSLAGNVNVLIPMQILNAFVVAVTSCLGMTYVQDLMPHSPGRATAFSSTRRG